MTKVFSFRDAVEIVGSSRSQPSGAPKSAAPVFINPVEAARQRLREEEAAMAAELAKNHGWVPGKWRPISDTTSAEIVPINGRRK